MALKTPEPLKPGMELTAAWLNWVLAASKRNQVILGVDSGLEMSQNENGTALRVSGGRGGINGQIAYTISSISARAGTVPGSGSTYSVVFDGTNLVTQDGTGGSQLIINATYNFAATSVAGNKYCWIEENPSAIWWLVSVEC